MQPEELNKIILNSTRWTFDFSYAGTFVNFYDHNHRVMDTTISAKELEGISMESIIHMGVLNTRDLYTLVEDCKHEDINFKLTQEIELAIKLS